MGAVIILDVYSLCFGWKFSFLKRTKIALKPLICVRDLGLLRDVSLPVRAKTWYIVIKHPLLKGNLS